MKLMIVSAQEKETAMIRRIASEAGLEEPEICAGGRRAVETFRRNSCDLIVMQIDLDGPLDGIQCVQTILRFGEPWVIYIISGGSEVFTDAIDRRTVAFLLRPLREDDVRAALMLARYRLAEPASGGIRDNVRFGTDCRLDCGSDRLEKGGEAVELTRMELRLLKLLLRQNGVPLDARTLAVLLYPDRIPDETVVRTLVSRLRRKLPGAVETLKGRGYAVTGILR